MSLIVSLSNGSIMPCSSHTLFTVDARLQDSPLLSYHLRLGTCTQYSPLPYLLWLPVAVATPVSLDNLESATAHLRPLPVPGTVTVNKLFGLAKLWTSLPLNALLLCKLAS